MILLLFFVAVLFLPNITLAKSGVGVGLGSIKIRQELTPGVTYKLPSLPVYNTGDQPSYYQVGLSFEEGQVEKKPKEEWFHFTPKNFLLAPGKVQNVNITLHLPYSVRKGHYRTYLTAHPTNQRIRESENQRTSVAIGVAAATELSFRSKEGRPPTILGRMQKRLLLVRRANAPYRYWILLGLLASSLCFLYPSLPFEIKIKRK